MNHQLRIPASASATRPTRTTVNKVAPTGHRKRPADVPSVRFFLSVV